MDTDSNIKVASLVETLIPYIEKGYSRFPSWGKYTLIRESDHQPGTILMADACGLASAGVHYDDFDPNNPYWRVYTLKDLRDELRQLGWLDLSGGVPETARKHIEKAFIMSGKPNTYVSGFPTLLQYISGVSDRCDSYEQMLQVLRNWIVFLRQP